MIRFEVPVGRTEGQCSEQSPGHPQGRGQVLVVVAIALVVIVAMVALVIDGGYAWAKQRDTQNAADSAADAGATVLMQRLAGVPEPPPDWDGRVIAAVNQAATENGAVVDAAYYTNVDGELLTSGGSVAPDEASAARVGDGPPPPGASGVRAVVSQQFDTFLAQAVGIDTLTASAPATAVSGYLKTTCAADAGCIVLPLTFPVTMITCDGSNKIVQIPTYWPSPSDIVIVPLCNGDPGDVGWLDWTPTGGGTGELAGAIESPNGPPVAWPQWYYVTQTGGPDAVEGSMRMWDGQVVLMPLFDSTCNEPPTGPGINECAPGPGGNGPQQWYHLAAVTAFEFCGPTIPECVAAGYEHGAYIQGGTGGNGSVCQVGNAATDCLVGRFVRMAYEGQVTSVSGPNPDPNNNQALGVQLIH